MRRFYKISLEQFQKDNYNDENLYNNFPIPIKKDKFDSIYSFKVPYDMIINEREIVYIPTCVYTKLNSNELLMIFPLKEINFGRYIREANSAELKRLLKSYNELDNNQIFIRIENIHNKKYSFKKGDTFCTGTFGKYIKKVDEKNIDINKFDKIT